MQKKKILALTLIGAMGLNCVACAKDTTTTKKKNKKSHKVTETTVAETEPEKNEPELTPEVTPEVTPEITLDYDPGIIEFLDEDLRYHYDLDIDLDPDTNRVYGSVIVDFYNNSDDAWDTIVLRDYPTYFEGPTVIENITDHRTGDALSMTREGEDQTVVHIPLTNPLKGGEQMTLSYDFEVTLPVVNDRYGLDEDNGIYNVTNFYPILGYYHDGEWSEEPYFPDGECFVSEISDYDVTLTLPSDMVVASTGVITDEQVNGDIKVVTMEAPCVRDFVFCASSNFNVIEQDCNGVNVRFIYTKNFEDSISQLSTCTFDSIDYTFDFAEDNLGMYPYEELDVVLSNMSGGNAGGMEYPNLVIINLYINRGIIEEETYENILIHEVIHQWFMGIVGSNSGTEAWLDEGVTQYVSDSIFGEFTGEHFDYLTDSWDLISYNYLAEDGYFPISRKNVEFLTTTEYVVAVYQMTAVTLGKIHDYMGDDLFYEFLNDYVHTYAFKNATGDDFFDLLLQYDSLDDEELRQILEMCWELEF
ncbi:MAG: M1 family metallopeptidase [Saccharofermentans sp.]|nr:M1 family metallopeptidase [Saccharofermentans sp.]